MWGDGRKYTHLLGISGKLEMVLASLTTGGEECSKSIRRIAREGLHDRRTVRKFLRDAGPPRYTLKVPRRRPVLEPFLRIIQRWLREDESRPSKQHHTAHRIGVGLAGLCERAPRPKGLANGTP